MIKTLKKATIRYLLPWILVLAVLAAGLIGISAQGIVLRLAGPKQLADLPVDESISGKYVSFDASEVIVACASLSQTRDGKTVTLKTYYLLSTADGRYTVVVDHKNQHESEMSRAMEQSHEYYLGELETLTKIGTLKGTVKPLENGMDSYMTKCITEYTLPGYEEGGDLSGLIFPYMVDLQNIGFLSGTLDLILFGLGILFLLGLLALLIPALKGVYQANVKNTVCSEHSEEEADTLFDTAETIETVKVGEYIWFSKGAKSCCLKTDSILWGYAMPEPLVVSKYRWPVALYDAEQNLTQVCFMDKKNGSKLLNLLEQNGHPFISGYSTTLAQKLKNDPDGFAEMAKQASQERSARK